MVQTANWLIVESLTNWQVDHANQFSYFGVTKRFEKKLTAELKSDDLLFTYVTGRCCFADIRRATKPGIRRLPMGGDYELSLPLCIDTAPALILEPEQWLPIGEIRDRLELTAGKKYWGQVFRSAPRQLDPKDAALLTRALHLRKKGSANPA